MKISTLPFIAYAMTVVADSSAIQSIDNAITSFDSTLTDWQGSWLGIPTVLSSALGLKKSIDTACTPPGGTKLAVESAEVQKQWLIAANSLVGHVGNAVDTAIAKRSLAESTMQGLGRPIAKAMIETYRSSIAGCGDMFRTAISSEKEHNLDSILDSIDGHLARGVAAYS